MAPPPTLFLTAGATLFGKDVTVQRWINKPPLIQCSCCHALGYNKAFKVCTLDKDFIRCHICHGTHKGENYNHHCPCKHAVAGICDYKNYKCLNCQKPQHDCWDSRCPARDLFHPQGNHKTRSKGKAWAPGPWLEETTDLDGAPLWSIPSCRSLQAPWACPSPPTTSNNCTQLGENWCLYEIRLWNSHSQFPLRWQRSWHTHVQHPRRPGTSDVPGPAQSPQALLSWA